MTDKLFILFFMTSAVWGSSIDGIRLPVIGSLFPLRIAVLLFAVIVLFKTYIEKQKIMIIQTSGNRMSRFKNTTLYCGAAMMITGLITIYWAYDTGVVFVDLVTWFTSFITLAMCLFYLKSFDDVLFASRIYTLNFIIIGGIGIYESFTGDYYKMVYDFYSRQKNFLGLYMPASTMININNFAMFMVLSLPICFIATQRLKGKSLLDMLLLVFSGFVTVLTGCNTALIVLCLVIALYAFYNRTKKVSWVLIAAIIITLLIFGSIIGNIFNEIINFSVKDEPRFAIWKNAIEVAWRYKFMGIGPGNGDIINGLYAENRMNATTVHNYLLTAFEEFGIIGGGFFIYWVLKLIYNAFAVYIETKHAWLKNALIFAIIFLPSTLCMSTMVGYYFVWAEFGILVALCDVCEKQNLIERNVSDEPKREGL